MQDFPPELNESQYNPNKSTSEQAQEGNKETNKEEENNDKK